MKLVRVMNGKWYLVVILLLIGNISLFAEDMLQEADASYLRGEQGITIAQKEENFNHALTLYMKSLGRFGDLGQGKLYYNIGNTFFQLGQYPFAVYYYYQAINLMPRNEQVKANLRQALAQLGVEVKAKKTLFDQPPFNQFTMSIPEKVQLFSFLFLILAFLVSIYVWVRPRWLPTVAILFSLLPAVLFFNLIYAIYFTPIEGIIVESTLLYRASGENYPPVSSMPVLAGNKLKVVALEKEGHWLKVISPNGQPGFVPARSMRLID
jgi:tetratricopeptide (TPR) repeat protein